MKKKRKRLPIIKTIKNKKTRKEKEELQSNRRYNTRQAIRVFTRMAVEGISEKEARLKDIDLDIKRFDDRIRSAYIGFRDLNMLLQDLDGQKIEELRPLFNLSNVTDLLQELKKLLPIFGYDYKRLQIEE